MRAGILLVGLGLALGSCGDRDAAVDGDCADASQCDVGQACLDGACVAAECFESAGCPLDHWCDPASWTCEPGCQVDGDCLYGQLCEAGECAEAYSDCATTQTDCPLGEICGDDGVCAVPPEPFCSPCGDVADCGGADCYQFSESDTAYCGVDCQVDADCPQSFWCGQVNYGNESSLTCQGPCQLL